MDHFSGAIEDAVVVNLTIDCNVLIKTYFMTQKLTLCCAEIFAVFICNCNLVLIRSSGCIIQTSIKPLKENIRSIKFGFYEKIKILFMTPADPPEAVCMAACSINPLCFFLSLILKFFYRLPTTPPV